MENQQNLSSPCFSTDSVKGFFSFRNSFESSSDKWSPISIYSGKNFPLQWLILLFVILGNIQGWFWQSQSDGIKQMERMGPHTFLGQSIPDCDQDFLLTGHSRNHILLKGGHFEKFMFKRRHMELEKNKLNFPSDRGGWESLDCRIWAAPYSEMLRNHGRKE